MLAGNDRATQRSFVFLRILRFCNRLCDLLFSSSNQRVQNCLKSTRTVLGTYVYILYNYATLVQGRPKKQTPKLGTVLVRLNDMWEMSTYAYRK